jgi:hypothetical protein
MKTVKILSVLSLVLIFATANAIIPGDLDSKAPKPLAGNIKYKVVVHATPDLTMPGSGNYLVVMSDGNGRRIGTQYFIPGVLTYFFSERGPVNGTRVVRIIIETHGGVVPFYCNPDVKYGTFRDGVTYQFNMYPKTSVPD